jgi:hypothetical protein
MIGQWILWVFPWFLWQPNIDYGYVKYEQMDSQNVPF